MPNFGNGSSRPVGRKPRHGKTGAPAGSGRPSEPRFKEREDGRGGRSPKRQAFFEAKQDAPRDDRGARPERGDDRGGRPGFNRDDRGGRPPFNRDRDDRGARPERGDDRRRDWAPREDRGGRPGFNRDRDDRPAGRFDRDDRGSRPAFNRDDRGGRPAFNRDDRPSAHALIAMTAEPVVQIAPTA